MKLSWLILEKIRDPDSLKLGRDRRGLRQQIEALPGHPGPCDTARL
jgi:hypothetical protein